MNKLFWRIFGSFWLLLIALAGATLAINTEGIERNSPPGQPLPPLMDRISFELGLGHLGPHQDMGMGLMGHMQGRPPQNDGHGFAPMDGPGQDGGPGDMRLDAVQRIDTQGVKGLAQYFNKVKHNAGSEFYLFDQAGKLVSGNSPGSAVIELTRETLATSRFQMAFDKDTMLHSTLIYASNHKHYVLIDSMAPPSTDWSGIALHLLGALVIASMICWWLTAQITKPVQILRGVTHDIAAGNFGARTAPKLNGRKDELGQLGQDFDSMADKLQTVINAQVRLIADISHELRSPLTRLALASALARRSAGSGSLESLDRVDFETERLNELIGQLTSLSRLEMGSAQPLNTPVNMNELVQHAASSARFEASAKNCSIRLTPNPLSLVVCGDRELLHRAVENILRNAVRYSTPASDILLSLEFDTATNSANLVVIDHGPGVPDAELEAIFDPFYRTSLARDRDSGGVGLGLAIAKRAIRQHGGSITACNRNDGQTGLVVAITLPSRTRSIVDRMKETSEPLELVAA